MNNNTQQYFMQYKQQLDAFFALHNNANMQLLQQLKHNFSQYKLKQFLTVLLGDLKIMNHAGDCDVMPKGKLHRIVNHGYQQWVATIMCSAPIEQGTTRLTSIHIGVDPNIQPPKVTVQQMREALHSFLNELNTQQEYCNAA